MSSAANNKALSTDFDLARPRDPARVRKHRHSPTKTWLALRWILASSKDHAFLDRSWIKALFAICPSRQRHKLALHLLSLSPHYWIYQWTNKYSCELDRWQVLQMEYDRNAASRKVICDKILARFLNQQMTVLDFGCGPGFLAKQASRRVRQMIGTDVSRGVIQCAKHLNGADNLNYVSNGNRRLQNVDSSSVDLVYSFAVFQHLQKLQTRAFFEEFFRVLRPGGQGVIHTILKSAEQAVEQDPEGWLQRRVMLRMVYYSQEEMTSLLSAAGFVNIGISDIKDLAEVDDDIGQEQLVTFKKPCA